MKILLLIIIKLYWLLVPKSKRRKCLFRTSCSKHVYQVTKEEGIFSGLLAFKYRVQNCRSGFQVFEDPIDGRSIMILANYQVLKENEIAERFIKHKV